MQGDKKGPTRLKAKILKLYTRSQRSRMPAFCSKSRFISVQKMFEMMLFSLNVKDKRVSMFCRRFPKFFWKYLKLLVCFASLPLKIDFGGLKYTTALKYPTKSRYRALHPASKVAMKWRQLSPWNSTRNFGPINDPKGQGNAEKHHPAEQECFLVTLQTLESHSTKQDFRKCVLSRFRVQRSKAKLLRILQGTKQRRKACCLALENFHLDVPSTILDSLLVAKSREQKITLIKKTSLV